MLDYSKLINNSKSFEIVSQDIKNAKISHAYLFVNDDEIYLEKFCEEFSKLLINEKANDNEKEKNTIRIYSHNHPDVKVYGKNETINVDLVKDIVEQSTFKPFEADKKLFVILNMQNVGEVAQNKILKTIEEPPENTYFLLATKSTSKLLSTILSRVKKVELENPTETQIEEMLSNSGVEKSKVEIFASCSGNNASIAEKMVADEKFIDFFNQIVTCLYEVNGSRNVLKWSNIFSSKQVDKNLFFDILVLLFRDINIILSQKDELVINKNIISKLKLISSMLSVDSVSALIKICLKAKEQLQFNINPTALVDEFLFKLAEVKVKCRR